ncbi:uncharacterized protein LOC133206055 [Saccostrea echinata]|uniref:uncharacterized protein LOC133206055 n=1 Tax=Saccostrea echinata TaxID=191078 RepID=UPI002A8249A3|nr:uncharacterized protein LOC133206055 [Saccostrea echinata]
MRKLHFFQAILGLLFAIRTNAMIWETDMPNLLKQCYEQFTQGLTVGDIPGHSVQSYCLSSYIWQSPHLRHQLNLTESQVNYIRSFYREYQHRLRNTRRHKRQAQRAFRREIRVLDDAERQRFFNALAALKENGFYDTWASVHNGIVLPAAHGGPAFPGFHRVYLLFLEFALQRIDGSVSLCYWDSTMDNDMVNPRETSLFTTPLVGNGNGNVRTGPFAGWTVPDGSVLNRNIGSRMSALMTKPAISRFLTDPSVTSHTQILVGYGQNLANTLEGQHNNVHVWVGGHMVDATVTAYDPVFFLHHTFIDYIWERFRQKIRQLGVDPETDYPWPMRFRPSPLHNPNRNMDTYSNYTNLDGYSDIFATEFFQYDDMPSCASNCGNSRFLTCQGGVCVARTASDIGEATSAQIMARTAFSFDAVSEEEPEPAVPFLASFVDPRTMNQNGMNGAAGGSPAGGVPFQSSMNDPRTGNGFIRNGASLTRGTPVGSLQGMRGFNTGVLPGRFGGGSSLANFLNPSLSGVLGTGGQNFGTRQTNMLRSGIGQNALALQSGTQNRFTFTGQPGNLQQRLFASPNSPIRHLWNPSTQQINTQTRGIGIPSQIHNSPFNLEDVRRLAHLHDIPIQNTFTLDGISDIRRWVFMPVRIVYMRPPGNYFGSRIVRNSKIVQNVDMYSPQAYTEFMNISPKISPATYPNCYKNLGGSTRVFVQSDGFSYRGTYMDYAVIDERQPISEAISYVAVKNPDLGAAQLYLTASDSCGRVCQPRCLVPGSNPPAYRPCSGVVNLTNRSPRMYGRTYGEAVRNRWNFGNKNCPSSYGGEIFMTFYCDYENVWPWKNCNRETQKISPYYGK